MKQHDLDKVIEEMAVELGIDPGSLRLAIEELKEQQ